MKTARYKHTLSVIFYTFATVIATLSLYSCNDMETSPINEFTDKTYWTTPERAQYVLNMAYKQMYNVGWMFTDESLSDNMIDGRSICDQRLIRLGQASPITNVFEIRWSEMYGGIKTCHVFLENVDCISNFPEASKARMIAQIRFIRAYLYFRLTTYWGAIPFFTKDISLDEANNIARTDHETVVNFIEKELDEIAEDLPTNDQLAESERGNITRGAAIMLKARVCLMESDWQGVVDCCEKLIFQQSQNGTYELFPTYRGLFSEANEYNNEVILDRAYVRQLITWDEMQDMIPLTQGGRVADRVPTQALVDSYIMLDGSNISSSTTYNSERPYENRDPRMTATIIYDGYDWSANVDNAEAGIVIHTAPDGGTNDSYVLGSNSSQTGYYLRKWYAPQTEGSLASGLNIIFMRYADVLLMYAEAKMELGQFDETVWNETIKPIRERAGFTLSSALSYPMGKSQDQIRTIIRNERRSELAIEGLRWYDIKRWKAGKQFLNGYVYGATFNNSTIRLDYRQFDENRDYLWAVPQSQIDLNPNLGPNNPGYAN